MITRANYEQFFLDYHEATLDAKSEKDLIAFLNQNPDLREEFEGFIQLNIEPDLGITFSDLSTLHRSDITERNYLSKLVAYEEGDLDKDERLTVELYIDQNYEAAKELEILRKTRIAPDYNVVFKDKNSLKKESKVIFFDRTFYIASAVAASLLILFLSYFSIDRANESPVFVEEKPVQNSARLADSKNSEGAGTVVADIKLEATTPNVSVTENQSFAQAKLSKGQKRKKEERHEQQELFASEEFAMKEAEIIDKVHLQENSKSMNDIILATNNDVHSNFAVNTNKDQPLINSGGLSSVFTPEELVELGIISDQKKQQRGISAWDLAETGIAKLGKVTGTKMEFERHSDHIENATTYALELGRFSVSHTRVTQ